MSVKVEASGRRSVETSIELEGTPEQVWQAIATGPGISAWLMPAEIVERDGKPVALTLYFGTGMEPTSAITAYEAPRLLAMQSAPWTPDSPPMASEWHVEAKAGGTCTLRIVQSLFASTDAWDHQIEGAAGGLLAFLATLRLYLRHFPGERSTLVKFMVPTAGTETEVWDRLMGALGLNGVGIGQPWSAPAGVPALGGVTEYYTENPYDALVRIDTPGPGIAAFGTVSMGGPTMVGMNLYLYGDQGAATAGRERPRWEIWFEQHFPMQVEGNADA
jgi:uncharacterized protein YndB with AHSA1/START domain